MKHSESILRNEFPNLDRARNTQFLNFNMNLLDAYFEKTFLLEDDMELFFKENVLNKFFNQFIVMTEVQFLFQKIDHEWKDKFERIDDFFSFKKWTGPIEMIKKAFFEKSVSENTQFAFLQLSPIYLLQILHFNLKYINLRFLNNSYFY